jgi:hypothetical protein
MVSGLRVPLPSLTSSQADLKIVEVELLGERLNDPTAATAVSAVASQISRRSRMRCG